MIQHIAIILLMSFTLCACRVKKKIISSNEQQHIAAHQSNEQNQVSSSHLLSEVVQKDSILKIDGRQVADTLPLMALQPTYTIDGRPQAHSTIIRGKGISVTTTALPSGNVIIEGKCDSIEKLIPGYITIIRQQQLENQQLRKVNSNYASYHSIGETQHIVSKGVAWYVWLIGGIIILILIFYWLITHNILKL